MITQQELRTAPALAGATLNLGGNPIRSVMHPGKTRVDIFSEEQFEGLTFASRNDKEAVNAMFGNISCTSWDLVLPENDATGNPNIP